MLQVKDLDRYVPQAFPGASDVILDAELLLVDYAKKVPLPFGTLGVHKKAGFKVSCQHGNLSTCSDVFRRSTCSTLAYQPKWTALRYHYAGRILFPLFLLN